MTAVLRAEEPSARYLAEVEPALTRGFESLVVVPGGVGKLRNLILSLAIHGKLVPQSTLDSPAKSLLATIRAAGNKGVDAISLVTAEPFDLPVGWQWTPLGEVVDIVRGITFPANEKTKEPAPNRIACLRTTNVQKSVEWDDLLFVDRSFMGREDQLIRHHDVVMSMANSRELVGKVALIEGVPHPEATFGGFLGVLRPSRIAPRYLMAVLRSEYARSALIGSASQTTNIANISLGKLRPLPFPLPPLAEQHRIVARVEELMKLCDALEQNGRLTDEQHARLTSTLFDALAASESAYALAENWKRVAEHFDLLLESPESVDALERTILQLAVRGLLVPQELADEPAIEFVAHADPGSAEDTAFPLPRGWVAARFPDLCSISGGSTPSKGKADFWDGHIPWVSPKDMKRDVISDAIDHVSEQALAQTSLALVPTGSVLIVVRGMILAHSFPTAITSAPVTINQDMKALSPRVTEMAPYLALICRGFKREILSMVERSTHGTCKLESAKLFGWQFGLPPFAEQRRILARVAELCRLCTDLRQRLTRGQATQSLLADALVAEVA